MRARHSSLSQPRPRAAWPETPRARTPRFGKIVLAWLFGRQRETSSSALHFNALGRRRQVCRRLPFARQNRRRIVDGRRGFLTVVFDPLVCEWGGSFSSFSDAFDGRGKRPIGAVSGLLNVGCVFRFVRCTCRGHGAKGEGRFGSSRGDSPSFFGEGLTQRR
jgi:hypothetical protein